jgi:sigma-B regulation protein RsbQ
MLKDRSMLDETVRKRNNVIISGAGDRTLVFAHGFGCDQTMWRFLIPHLRDKYQIVTFDYVGCGKSDPAAFSQKKYSSLEGYAQDILDVCEAMDLSDAILIGHSVSAMTGLIAAIKAPERIGKIVMVCPSPCFMNKPPNYHGGFEREDLDELIALMDENYIGWANHLSAVVMGLSGETMVGELAQSFCSTDPLFAKTFAKATFFSDCRDQLARANQATLVLQSSNDALAPVSVGRFVQSKMAMAELEVFEAYGHCLHMTHAEEIVPTIEAFIQQ